MLPDLAPPAESVLHIAGKLSIRKGSRIVTIRILIEQSCSFKPFIYYTVAVSQSGQPHCDVLPRSLPHCWVLRNLDRRIVPEPHYPWIASATASIQPPLHQVSIDHCCYSLLSLSLEVTASSSWCER